MSGIKKEAKGFKKGEKSGFAFAPGFLERLKAIIAPKTLGNSRDLG
jgi:hypothetical protein